MEEYQQLISIISLTMGVAWASGVNLYAAILVLGIGGASGGIDLPDNLLIVQDPAVIMAAGLMFGVEFFADKVPGVDTGWDALHTFIRIPAGALLAANAVGDVSPALQLAAGLVGGSVTSVTHAAKAGSRALINTSPEPVSNWVASISEDVAVLGGLWLALNHPVLFLAVFLVFLAALVWLLPKVWRGLRRVGRALRQWLGDRQGEANAALEPAYAGRSVAEALQILDEMRRQGSLSDAEFASAKARVLDEQAVGSPGAPAPAPGTA